MTDLGSQLRTYFEETTEPLTVDEVLTLGTVVVRDELDTKTGHSSPWPWLSGPWLAAAVAVAAVAAFVGIASMVGGPTDVTGVDSAEAARSAIEELYRALEEEDTEAIEEFFGASLAFNSYLGIDMVGTEAAAYHIRTIMVPMTVLEVRDPVQNEDGSFSIIVEVLPDTHRIPSEELYHVVMDGARVVSIDHDGNVRPAEVVNPFDTLPDP